MVSFLLAIIIIVILPDIFINIKDLTKGLENHCKNHKSKDEIENFLTNKQIIETMILYFVIFVIGVGIALIWF